MSTPSGLSPEAQNFMASLFGGASAPPSKSKVLGRRIGSFLGNTLAILLAIAFAVGLVDAIVFLVQLAGKLL